MLEVDAVCKTFSGPHGPVPVLQDLSLRVPAGRFIAVQGPSGCGKTTLLLIAAGLLRPDAGRVRLGGQDLYAMAAAQRSRVRATGVGMVFQQFHLVPYLSALENVLCPVLAADLPQARQRADELLERFGLSQRRDHLPSQMSTGERQRTALARALLHRPGLLLADEPTGNLDAQNAGAILDCLVEFARSGGAVLMVTHEAAAAARADEVVQLAAPRSPPVAPAPSGVR